MKSFCWVKALFPCSGTKGKVVRLNHIGTRLQRLLVILYSTGKWSTAIQADTCKIHPDCKGHSKTWCIYPHLYRSRNPYKIQDFLQFWGRNAKLQNIFSSKLQLELRKVECERWLRWCRSTGGQWMYTQNPIQVEELRVHGAYPTDVGNKEQPFTSSEYLDIKAGSVWYRCWVLLSSTRLLGKQQTSSLASLF